jgi:hypothetical protein
MSVKPTVANFATAYFCLGCCIFGSLHQQSY